MKATSLALATLGIALTLADVRAQTPPRGYEHHVLRFTGAEAVRCGSYVRKRRESLDLTDEEFKRAFDCAAAARREGKAFFLSIASSGVEPYVASGIIGLRDSGALYSFSYRGPDCAGQGCDEAFGLGACGQSATTDAIDRTASAACASSAPRFRHLASRSASSRSWTCPRGS